MKPWPSRKFVRFPIQSGGSFHIFWNMAQSKVREFSHQKRVIGDRFLYVYQGINPIKSHKATIFLWFSYRFQVKPPFSHGFSYDFLIFPMVFLQFSYGFTRGSRVPSPWKSCDFSCKKSHALRSHREKRPSKSTAGHSRHSGPLGEWVYGWKTRGNINVYIYIYMYLYLYVYMYMSVCIYIYIHIYMYVYIKVYNH